MAGLTPPIRTALVDFSTGLVTTPWALFFQKVYAQLGGDANGSNIDDLEALLVEQDFAQPNPVASSSQVLLASMFADTQKPLEPSGVKAGAYTSANVTFDQYGRATAAANGGPTKTTNANGDAMIFPDTTKLEWGSVSGLSGVAVTFPVPFTAAPSVVCTAAQSGIVVAATDVTPTGFTADFGSATSGQQAYWHASGK